MLFAVAGIVRPRIVVSAGALTWLDDDELEAALAHERAHIVRRHCFVTVVAVGLAALGRAVPGTRHALLELGFHLERDADWCALRQRNDRLALASAICKAASLEPLASPALASLGSSGVRERLSQLLSDPFARPAGPIRAATNALAMAMSPARCSSRPSCRVQPSLESAAMPIAGTTRLTAITDRRRTCPTVCRISQHADQACRNPRSHRRVGRIWHRRLRGG